LLQQPQHAPLLSEEVLVTGFGGSQPVPQVGRDWIEDDEALRLLAEAKPEANIPMVEKRQLTESALDVWPKLETALREKINARATELEKSHKRVRQAVSMRVRELSVEPQFPPDLLGLLVLQPIV
jgi:hypothetical protein